MCKNIASISRTKQFVISNVISVFNRERAILIGVNYWLECFQIILHKRSRATDGRLVFKQVLQSKKEDIKVARLNSLQGVSSLLVLILTFVSQNEPV